MARQKQTHVVEGDRYKKYILTRMWIEVLKKSEDFKGWGNSEIIKRALADINSGEISESDIEKAKAKIKSAPAKEEKKEPGNGKAKG